MAERVQVHLLERGRNPFQVALMGTTALSGLVYLLRPHVVPRVLTPLPGWLRVVWYAILLVGGLGCLIAVFWPDVVSSLLYERAMLYLLGSSVLTLAVLILLYAHWGGLTGALTDVGYGLACFARIGQITRKIRNVGKR